MKKNNNENHLRFEVVRRGWRSLFSAGYQCNCHGDEQTLATNTAGEEGKLKIRVWQERELCFRNSPASKLNISSLIMVLVIGGSSKKRVNVRLDLGFGKGQTGFIFNINEAF